MSDRAPSGREPAENGRDNYRHPHQDIRLGGLAPQAQNVESLGAAALRAVDGLARRYATGSAPASQPTRGAPPKTADVKRGVAEVLDATKLIVKVGGLSAWKELHERLNDMCLEARRKVSDDPTTENQRNFLVAEEALTAFQYGEDSAWADERHVRHGDWVKWHNKRASELTANRELGKESGLSSDPVFRYLMAELDAAWFRHRQNPTAQNHAALELARETLKTHPLYLGLPIDCDEELEDFVMPPVTEQAFPGAQAFERSSLEILADHGLTTEPVVTETFTDIWCIFCDRDQIQFIGTNRLECRMEIALTLHAAFWTMVRMSGFSEEVVATLDGVDLDDPCLDTLARALNSVTHDRYSFAPYETAIEARFLNFLQ